RFDHTIGEKQQMVSGLEVDGPTFVLSRGREAEHQSPFRELADGPVTSKIDGRVVARVRVGALSALIQNPEEERDEAISHPAPDEAAVDIGEYLRGREVEHRLSRENALEHGSQQGGGHSLSGDIS